MKIIDKLPSQTTSATSSPSFSFEFFPPKNAEAVEQLLDTVSQLAELDPAFVSVTWGAGGGTRRLTVELVKRMREEIGVEAMAHLTCVGASQSDLGEILDELQSSGIENILALRGDPPKGEKVFVQAEDGFAYASELVSFIRSRNDFCLGAACYPESHQEAVDAETDLDHLQLKVDAGVDFLITQMFFDNERFFDFVGRARARGITQPIIPGIMPITNFAQMKRMSNMCGAGFPKDLQERLLSVADSPAEVRVVGIDHATRQCLELLKEGAPGVHFYTLNRSLATARVLQAVREQTGTGGSVEQSSAHL
jgi:methylenetetrahydrofolate reductase (NADPH)